MGRKRSRKKQREQGWAGGYQPYDDPVAQGPSDPFLFAAHEPLPRLSTLGNETPRATATCDSCHEFVPDGDAGRGTCLHPASGVLSPWTDTPACPFYEAQLRTRRIDDGHI